MLAPTTSESGCGYSLPTPTAQDHRAVPYTIDGPSKRRRLSLLGHARLWPTPQARDGKGIHSPEYIAKKKSEGHGMSNLPDAVKQLPNAVGGALNPTWVEWLMGFPLEWTGCVPWATRRCRSKRPRPSNS